MPRNSASRESLSSQQERFAQAPSVSIQRSTFDRSFSHKTTFDEGELIPFLVDEILPGDTIELNTTLVVRMATPKFPIMSLLWVTTHFFFVPNRILWLNWKGLQGEQRDPDDDVTTFVMPTVDSPVGGWPEGSLGDYMGLPIDVDLTHNVLPMRAYNRIYKEWYRDQDLVDSPFTSTLDSGDVAANYSIFMRAKKHDYFTSARPWPIKGGVESTLPLAGAAPVVPDVVNIPTWNVGVGGASRFLLGSTSNNDVDWSAVPSVTGLASWDNPSLEADMSGLVGPSINQMRESIVLQQALELDGRSGTRYVEALRARWKVTSPDFRLQRPEYIGGGKQPLGVDQVAQTSKATSGSVGDLGGFAYSVGDGHRASYSATEHGQLIGIVSVSGDMEYQEGMHRMWQRSERFDFYEPMFANLGEQEIFNYELFADGTPTDDEVWGYQERWAEYRYKPGQISGAFRSTAALPLDAWHTAEEFGSLPPLAQQFIEMSSEAPNIGRCVQVPSEPHFLMDSFTSFRHTRAMPVFSVPGLTRF